VGYYFVKFVVFLFLSYALFSASIAHSEGFYFSGKAGASILQDADFFGENGLILTTSHDVGFNVGGALGYQWNKRFRGELEFSYQQNGLDTAQITQSNLPSEVGLFLGADGEFHFFNFMLNGFLDFANNSPVTPYLMAGMGGSQIRFDDVQIDSIIFLKDSITRFAYQFGTGLAYDHSENIDLTLDYRFFGTDGSTFLSHNIAVGVRFYLSPKSKHASSSRSASTRKNLSDSQNWDGNEEIKSVRNVASNSKSFKNDPRLLISKKECASVTNNPYIPPYTNEFLDCMKEHGWNQKK
jgi:opacity protein-like surface antigen